jgi:hypothetical protein
VIMLAAADEVLLNAPADTDESRKERRRWRMAEEESGGGDEWCRDDNVVAERSLAARDAAKGKSELRYLVEIVCWGQRMPWTRCT